MLHTRSRTTTPEDISRSKWAALALVVACLAILVALALSASGCRLVGSIPLPEITSPSTSDPTPAPPSPICVGEDASGCYVEPSAGTFRYVCSTPWVVGGITLVESPALCPSPPIAPHPEPTPAGCLIVPGSEWQIQPRTRSPYIDAVNAALLEQVGERCAVGSSCPLQVGGEQAFIDSTISRLRAGGVCAGRQVENGDKVAVGLSQADNWTFHVVGFGTATRPPTVAWQPSNAEPPDHWIAPSTVPTDEPKCLSLSRIGLKVEDGKALRHIDATPHHHGLEDCVAFGHSPTRDYCPLGMEGDPRRAECETRNGPYTWTVTPDPGWELAPEPDGSRNPLVIKLQKRQAGFVTVCSATGVCATLETR